MEPIRIKLLENYVRVHRKLEFLPLLFICLCMCVCAFRNNKKKPIEFDPRISRILGSNLENDRLC